MPDRPQQFRIHSRQPRQSLRIQPIVLPAAGADQLHLPRIRHDHLVPKAAQQPAHPRRMRSHFDRDPTLWQATKSLLHPFLSRRHLAFPHHLSFAVQHIIVAGLVSQVHADRDRSLAGLAPLRTLWTSVILLHGRFSFLHLECVSIGSLPHPAGDRPSHSISESGEWASRKSSHSWQNVRDAETRSPPVTAANPGAALRAVRTRPRPRKPRNPRNRQSR